VCICSYVCMCASVCACIYYVHTHVCDGFEDKDQGAWGMYVCMYVCMYVYSRASTALLLRQHMHREPIIHPIIFCIYVYTFWPNMYTFNKMSCDIYIYIYIYIYTTHVHIQQNFVLYICIYICMYIYMHIYIHIYIYRPNVCTFSNIYICIHIYIHTYTTNVYTFSKIWYVQKRRWRQRMFLRQPKSREPRTWVTRW
jgi:hypothetical protein